VAIRQGVRVVLCDSPVLHGHSHIYNQKLSLLNALDCVMDDAFVMKQRIDFLNLPWLENFLSAKPAKAQPGAIFSSSVQAHSFFLTQPFYINDILFVGMKTDLLKLCMLDVVALDHMPNIGAEQLFHASPFLQQRAWLRDYYRVNPGLALGTIGGSHAFLRAACENRYFLSVIAAYFGEMILNYVSFYDQVFEHRFDGRTAYDFLCTPEPHFEFNEGCQLKLSVSIDSLKALSQRTPDDSALGYLVSQMNAYVGRSMSFDLAERASFLDMIRKAYTADTISPVELAPHRPPTAGPMRLKRTSGWQINRDDVSVVTKLQNEISQLRRLVEAKR
jgi:hypothetical protein